jgi:enterobacterial common antigen flippase
MSFARILRSSALMGGAQVVVLAAGFLRTKVIALLLGPAGVGLAGLFNTYSGNISALAGWGLGTSGVRLIAGATADEKPKAQAAVRRMGWVLSLIGLALGCLLFWPATWLTFSTNEYALEMAIVALAVPCLIASGTWSALLQAAGKVGSLAKVQITGAIAGTVLGLPLIYFYGTTGVALSILLAAAVSSAFLWWAARIHCSPKAGVTVEESKLDTLVKIGGALMVAGWASQLSTYLVRMAIARMEGIDAAGLYQAAFAIAGSLPGFVFAAMGADFFPRVASTTSEEDALKTTEKQIIIGVMLAAPLIGIILLFDQEILALLFTKSFEPAALPMKWLTWGIFVRLLAWPLGYWMIAKSKPKVFIAVETSAAILLVVLQAWLTHKAGLTGAGIGFFLAYIAYALALVVLARIAAGRWLSSRPVGFILATALLLASCQYGSALLDNLIVKGAMVIGLALWSAFAFRIFRSNED